MNMNECKLCLWVDVCCRARLLLFWFHESPVDAPALCLLAFGCVQKYVHVNEKDFVSLFVQYVRFFVSVCVCFQVEEKGGSLQQGTAEWSEGNGKEMTKAWSLILPLSLCRPVWKLGHTHTHSLLLLWLWWKLWYTGSETQDGKHWTWRIEIERERKGTETERGKKKAIDCSVK